MIHALPRSIVPCLLLCCLSACQPVVPVTDINQDTRPLPSQPLFTASQQLYNTQCATCHGVTGQGDGAAAYLLYPKPRNFVSHEYRLISTDTMEATDEDLFTTITRGMPGSSMPSWESLSVRERWGLVYYLRYLEEVGDRVRVGDLTQADVDAGLPWETVEALMTTYANVVSMDVPEPPVSTPDSVQLGQQIYAQACAACHGATGRGDGQQVMEDNDGFPVRPRDLTVGLFKGSSSSRDLYYRIQGGLPGSPMPGYAGAYAQEQVWQLVHYLQSLVPEGAEERSRMRVQEIVAGKIRGEIVLDPQSSMWQSVPETYIAVTPLWWHNERTPGIDVQAVHNGKRIAIKLSWIDASHNNAAVKTDEFPDGIAVQLSTAERPPFFGMGDSRGEVDIWQWKSVWQEDLAARQDVEHTYPNMAVEYYHKQKNWELGTHQENIDRGTEHQDVSMLAGWSVDNPMSNPHRTSAAERAHAQGQSSLTYSGVAAQHVQAQGAWLKAKWTVVLTGDLQSAETQLVPGASASIAFAVWDGAKQDRGGQKSFSIWHTLVLGK